MRTRKERSSSFLVTTETASMLLPMLTVLVVSSSLLWDAVCSQGKWALLPHFSACCRMSLSAMRPFHSPGQEESVSEWKAKVPSRETGHIFLQHLSVLLWFCGSCWRQGGKPAPLPLRCWDSAMVVTQGLVAPREKAEQAIWNRLQLLKALKSKRRRTQSPLRIGILGTAWGLSVTAESGQGWGRLC